MKRYLENRMIVQCTSTLELELDLDVTFVDILITHLECRGCMEGDLILKKDFHTCLSAVRIRNRTRRKFIILGLEHVEYRGVWGENLEFAYLQ